MDIKDEKASFEIHRTYGEALNPIFWIHLRGMKVLKIAIEYFNTKKVLRALFEFGDNNDISKS